MTIKRFVPKFESAITEFKVAVAAFTVMFVLIVAVVVLLFLFRGEGFSHACEEIKHNNHIFTQFLEETEDRTVHRYHVEIKQGINPPYSLKDIESAYHPLIENLENIDC